MKLIHFHAVSSFFYKNENSKRSYGCMFIIYLGGGFKYFNFYLYLGKIPILTNIFQRG